MVFCLCDFCKIDDLNTIPDPKGELTIKYVKIDGQIQEIADVRNSDELWFDVHNVINDFEINVDFSGNLRNGHLHSIIKFDNNTESHVPDRGTFLMDFGFFDDYRLFVYGGVDTGFIQSNNGTINLSFNYSIRKTPTTNDLLEEATIAPFGLKKIYKYGSMPSHVKIKQIELRIIEDPMFRPNFKRRVVHSIILKPRHSPPPTPLTTPPPNMLIEKNLEDQLLGQPPTSPCIPADTRYWRRAQPNPHRAGGTGSRPSLPGTERPKKEGMCHDSK